MASFALWRFVWHCKIGRSVVTKSIRIAVDDEYPPTTLKLDYVDVVLYSEEMCAAAYASVCVAFDAMLYICPQTHTFLSSICATYTKIHCVSNIPMYILFLCRSTETGEPVYLCVCVCWICIGTDIGALTTIPLINLYSVRYRKFCSIFYVKMFSRRFTTYSDAFIFCTVYFAM